MGKKNDDIFFDSKKLPEPKAEFVCWIDIMGSQATMTTVINRAANFIFKFHACVLECRDTNNIDVTYYPVMDGVYITSANIEALQTAINTIFKRLATIFAKEYNLDHSFIIRGAIAFGPVIHGRDISVDCNSYLGSADSNYKKQLLLGMPISQCYNGERDAPPFGVYMHDSAIAFGKLSGRFYRWWNNDEEFIKKLEKGIVKYFEHCQNRIHSLGMDKDKIEKYKALSKEYFTLSNAPTYRAHPHGFEAGVKQA
ncbi:MAG: hypothetical protein LBV18_06550 [Alistipes sp.]|jgi:hypothetical protein|nr:hypothetical protein [Alistipes sp.]